MYLDKTDPESFSAFEMANIHALYVNLLNLGAKAADGLRATNKRRRNSRAITTLLCSAINTV